MKTIDQDKGRGKASRHESRLREAFSSIIVDSGCKKFCQKVLDKINIRSKLGGYPKVYFTLSYRYTILSLLRLITQKEKKHIYQG